MKKIIMIAVAVLSVVSANATINLSEILSRTIREVKTEREVCYAVEIMPEDSLGTPYVCDGYYYKLDYLDLYTCKSVYEGARPTHYIFKLSDDHKSLNMVGIMRCDKKYRGRKVTIDKILLNEE